MTDAALAFVRPFVVASLPPKGTELTIEADAGERAGLAAVMDILAVDRLVADLRITPFRRTGIKVAGRVRATVQQACVVTLDPVEEAIDETFEVTFLPPAEIDALAGEVEVEVDAADPPEPLDGPAVDLGALAAEFVAVALDPYPRAPGATFEDIIEDAGEDDAPPSPFGKLAGLKPSGD